MTDVAQRETAEQEQPSFRSVGKPMPRNEDQRLVTGRGRFSDDFSVAGQAYAAMVRSPHPHARILARSMPRAPRPCRACSASSPAPTASPTGSADPARSAAQDASST